MAVVGSAARSVLSHLSVACSTFRDLFVWQQSMHLVRELYALSATLPPDERFGLSAQLKRAAISIASNIAEGARRRRPLTFKYHLEVALGSQAEIDVQLDIAKELGFIDTVAYREIQRRVDTVGWLLNRLIDSIQEN